MTRFKRRSMLQILLVLIALILTGCNSKELTEQIAQEQLSIEEASQETSQATLAEESEMNNCDFEVDYAGIERGINDGSKAAVHDPSVIKADNKYYIFGSHMTTAVSDDLTEWIMVADGYTNKNPVYTDLVDMKSGEFDFTGYSLSRIPTESKAVNVWAPDVVYNKALGKYCLYGCTSSTFNASTIYLAWADSIEGPYIWQKNLLYSGETEENIGDTDILDYVEQDTAVARYTTNAGFAYNYNEFPNCIDPTVFYDKEGRMWMVYGSWSGGIFLLEVDEQTGDVIHPEESEGTDVYYGKKLLGGGHHSIEGPYILYDETSDYYYLFVSYGELRRDGGYQIRVFRSKTVDGEYTDMNGAFPDKNIAQEYCGLKLSGNYYLPSLNVGYKATGHNSAFIDDDGRHYIIYHTRFDKGTEMHTPKAKQYFLNKEGWPCMLPYVTGNETISDTGYSVEEIAGRYYVINQGTKIDAEVVAPTILYLMEDGSVVGAEVSGNWKYQEGSYYMSLLLDGKEYSGVFCKMKDEASTEVMTFTAVGANESVWGVKY